MHRYIIKNKITGEIIIAKRRNVVEKSEIENLILPKNWIYKSCLNPQCTKVVIANKSSLKQMKFCSRRCLIQDMAAKRTIEKECLICGKKFTVKLFRQNSSKYCSVPCKAMGARRNSHKKVQCLNCNMEFTISPCKKTKYCSRECRFEYERKHNVLSFSNARGRLKQLGRFNKCEKCGYSEHPEILGVHHIDKNHDNNAIDNLIVLCPNCHSLEHCKHIPQGGVK